MAGSGLKYRDWRERVPELVEAAALRWGLTLGETYPPGAAGHVVRATLADGTPAVLKLVFPHREAEHEADALAAWDGDGAVRLLAADDDGWSFVMERCEPGELLANGDPDAALDVLAALLPRLWRVVEAPFHTLADEVAVWLRGEREFSVAPIVRDYVLGHSEREVVERLDRLTSALGLDRDRARWWTIGQTVAWMFESTQLHVHAETVRWLHAA